MGEIKLKDKIVIELSYGTFSNTIIDSKIVDADDTTVIQSIAPKEVLTLITFYPFRFVGNAPQRYILYAKRDE